MGDGDVKRAHNVALSKDKLPREPGTYTLTVRINPGKTVPETNYNNNSHTTNYIVR